MGNSDGKEDGINILDLLNNLPAVGDDGCVHQYTITEQQQGVCETAGYIVFTCTKCGSQYRQTLNPPGHQYEITETTATCTTAGSTKYTCKVCGAVTEKTGEALGHDYSLTKEVAPECEKIGYKEYTCSRCQKVVTEETEKLGHLLSSVEGPEDYQGHYMGCSRCGNPRASLVSHSIIYTWTEGLYTQNGDRAHVKACTVCGWENVEQCSDNSPANGYCAYCGRPMQ
ncbi:MAG: hypothetical protein HUJ75_08760 [Parasporobacterium sp.]|nr:hypothetical protein [Parasporobacterium sp.]